MGCEVAIMALRGRRDTWRRGGRKQACNHTWRPVRASSVGASGGATSTWSLQPDCCEDPPGARRSVVVHGAAASGSNGGQASRYPETACNHLGLHRSVCTLSLPAAHGLRPARLERHDVRAGWSSVPGASRSPTPSRAQLRSARSRVLLRSRGHPEGGMIVERRPDPDMKGDANQLRDESALRTCSPAFHRSVAYAGARPALVAIDPWQLIPRDASRRRGPAPVP